jgi:Rhamnan synthesis protein F
MSIFKEHNIGPGRKVLRELVRVKRDLIGLYYAAKFRLTQRRYDKTWPAQIRVTQGAIQPTNKIAILVLFQPDRLRKSTLETCVHLTANGYAVLAVSNAELSAESRAHLSQHVYQICERPNYGYDAGAYRDGVWMLRQHNLKPDRLILLNDSIWFPLQADNDAIERLENHGGFFGGLVRKTNNKVDIKSQKEPAGFIEAYFYQVNLSSKTSRAVWSGFWDQLKLTIGRAYLKEGRVSYFISRSGFDLTALGSRRSFLSGVRAMPTPELRKVLQYAAYSNPTLAEKGAALCAEPDNDAWRDAALHHIQETVARYPFYGSFIYGSETLLGLGFLKKTNTPLFRETRKAYLRAISAGDLPEPSDIVMSELKDACRADPETP